MPITKTVEEKYVWNKYDNMPTAYKDYKKYLKEGSRKVDSGVKKRLSRFP